MASRVRFSIRCLCEADFAVPVGFEPHCVDTVLEQTLSPRDHLKLINGRHLASLFYLRRQPALSGAALSSSQGWGWGSHQRTAERLSDGIRSVDHHNMGTRLKFVLLGAGVALEPLEPLTAVNTAVSAAGARSLL